MLEHFSSDGVDIAFIDVAPQGHDLSEPILLIHGFASNHRVNWVDPRWVETLAKAGRRVVAFDNRGHGAKPETICAADYRSRSDGPGRRQPARPFEDRARRRDGLFDGRADRGLSRARRAGAGARADPRRDRRSAHARLRAAGGNRARRWRRRRSRASPTRRSACSAPSPSGRRATWPRSPPASAARGGVLTPAEVARIAQPALVAVGERDTVAGDPRKLAAHAAAGDGASTFPAAITISRSATRRSRRRRSIFSPAGNDALTALRSTKVLITKQVTSLPETSRLRSTAGSTGRTKPGAESPWSWPRRKPEARTKSRT